MTLMKKYIWLPALIILMKPLYAQNINYKKGYVVNYSGDTLRGEVKIFSDEVSCSKMKIIFPDGSKKTYRPGDIKAYVRGSEQYKSFGTGDALHFMKKMNTGAVCIYQYTNRSHAPVPLGSYVTLVSWKNCRLYLESRNGNFQIPKGKKEFSAKISAHFNQYPALAQKIISGAYTYDDVFLIVKEYNDWIEKNKKEQNNN
jgi:hypothetical protein